MQFIYSFIPFVNGKKPIIIVSLLWPCIFRFQKSNVFICVQMYSE